MHILVEKFDGVALVTLNRPECKNAFNLPMTDAWAAALRDAAGDPEVGAIVVTGAGDAFCSGAELSLLTAGDRDAVSVKRMLTDHVHHVVLAIADIDKPLIAAVNGAAVGAGMDLSLMCDMRFAANSARFSEAYVNAGIVPGAGGCYILPRLVGSALALELLLGGEFISAETALRLGIVNRVYPDDVLLARTMEFAEKLARKPRLAVSLIKRTVRQSSSTDLRAHLCLVSSLLALVMHSEETKESLRALAGDRSTPGAEKMAGRTLEEGPP